MADGDFSGRSVAGGGDVNGDGFADLLIGVPEAGTPNTIRSGAGFIVYGGSNLGDLDDDDAEGADGGGDFVELAVTQVGTDADNRIDGGRGDDAVSGLDGADGLLGWEGDDLIRGGDTIDGGADDDELRGGLGSETFKASLGDDTAAGGAGADVLDFSSLGAAVTANMLTGFAALANGSATVGFSNIATLIGTAGGDSFSGDGQRNVLQGRGGNDALSGAGGNDTLVGDVGRDPLGGGADADIFDFNSVSHTGTAPSSCDVITDFEHLRDDLNLATIDAISGGANDAFGFIGTDPFTQAGQVRVRQIGADTLVDLNSIGPDGADGVILLAGIAAATLTAADFVL